VIKSAAFALGFLKEAASSVSEKKPSEKTPLSKAVTGVGIAGSGLILGHAIRRGAMEIAGSPIMNYLEKAPLTDREHKILGRMVTQAGGDFISSSPHGSPALLMRFPKFLRDILNKSPAIPRKVIGLDRFPDKHLVMASPDFGGAANFHELGHLKTELSGKSFLRRLYTKSLFPSMVAAKLLRPVTLGMAAGMAVKDPESREAKLAPLAAFLTAPSTLRVPGEIAASTWALSLLKKLRGGKGMGQARGQLLAALGTYFIPGTAAAVGVEAARRIAIHHKRMNETGGVVAS
jgi:hypothetical protein